VPWTFTSITYPVQCIYTQHIGFDPDPAQLQCNPQGTSLPAAGILSLSWGVTTITLPDCVVDQASIRLSPDGRSVMLNALDRRARWRNAPPISGSYNQIRAGEYVAARQKSLRQLAVILLTQLGEASAVVTALPTDIYPPVVWECEDTVAAARELLEGYGYTVSLGFGSEAVTVVQIGTGAALPTTGKFVGSDTITAKLVPRYVRNCFSRSAAQCRLLLEAVGQEADGSWLPIDDLSYAPAGGWGKVDPVAAADVKDGTTLTEYQLVTGYVYRAYRVKGFADDTWDLPDGSGSVSGLTDILPLHNRVLDKEDIRPDDSYQLYRVYGKYLIPASATGHPVVSTTTDIDDLVVNRASYLDGENGLLIFREPIYWVNADSYAPAQLWLETTINVRNQTTFAWNQYEYTVEVAPSGTGYHTVRHDQRAETIVTYDASHAVTGTTTNQTVLDDIGDAWAAAVIATYTATASQFMAYAYPVLTLRCDGAIQQVQHILTCGALEYAVNRTQASRFYEFDRTIPSRAQYNAHAIALAGADRHRRQQIRHRLREDADD
jgi:hypothetical protein